jgi:hypothetical protein
MDEAMDNPQGAWQAMVAAAVLGTGRSGNVPALPQELATIVPAADLPDAAMLSAAAVLDVYLRAGVAPVSGGVKLEGAPGSTWPVAGRGAVEQLWEILHGSRGALLAEWCEAARENQKSIAPQFLPELLRRAMRDRSLRGLVEPIVGERGRWLCAQNPEWRDLFVEPDVDAGELWQTGSAEQRRQLLDRLRALDPARGRGLVESTWTEGPPEDRSRFLEAMQRGLSGDDEVLLERGLDDRRKPVRDAAAEALARLPESGYAQRMATRLAGVVKYEPAIKGLLRKKGPQLAVTLPGDPNAEAKRDGLASRARGGLGPQAAMLADIVAAAPLSWWQQFPSSPDELIGSAMSGEYARALLEGWSRAAVRQSSTDWSEALLRTMLNVPAKQADVVAGLEIRPLIGVLPQDRAETIALEMLVGKATGNRTVELLDACRFRWSEALSRRVLAWLRQGNLANDYGLRHWMTQQAAMWMHPAVAEEAAGGWPEDLPPAVRGAIDQFILTVQFRNEMHKELRR